MFAAVAAAQGVVAPEAAFLQVGATTSGTEALTLGLLWRWPYPSSMQATSTR